MMLKLEHVAAGYGGTKVLFDVSLRLDQGEVLALLGRNGMGKTTTVGTIMGIIPAWEGKILFREQDLRGMAPFRIAQAGLGLAPEGRQIFSTLTVAENLVATASTRGQPAPRWTLPAIWQLFPRLQERRGNLGRRLSGGEQQMLAIGRALMTNPALLILDEATQGLAPVIRAEIWAALQTLKTEGLAILLIDKNLAAVLRLADRAVVIEKGRTVWSGDSAALLAAPEIRERHLHI